MDEAEKHQQRLEAMAQQEEGDQLRNESEEDWRKIAQKKRKFVRDHWLSETPSPRVPALSWPPQQDEADEHTAQEPTKSLKTFEVKSAVAQEANTDTVVRTAAGRTQSCYQAATDKDIQVNKAAVDLHPVKMAHRTFHETGPDGRSVLGMLAVQVERDPKTGETIVRSVAPVSTPAGAPEATTVFDDGRKSIHAVGGSGVQPSTEELGQILSVIDGVGMTVLLDEVTVAPNKDDTKTGIVEPSKVQKERVTTYTTTLKEDNRHLESSESHHLEDKVGLEKCPVRVENTHDKAMTAVMDTGEQVDGPVTLLFLGYTDSSESQEDHEGMITVERVMINEDGEECVIGPETSVSLQTPSVQAAEGEGMKTASKAEASQDVPLDENGAAAKVQGQEGDKQLHNSSLPSRAEGKGTSKRKTCQCCSVM